mmetsp:Transcript_14607/g.43908  ORF Transcript_14607/g.43908 Transcript_14607/m.43908 type:complete len:150 (+) Transcript_14607:158-607(+)
MVASKRSSVSFVSLAAKKEDPLEDIKMDMVDGEEEEIKMDMVDGEEEEGKITMNAIKKYGVAGSLSYFVTELLFWLFAIPVASFSFFKTAGHWPDFGDNTDRVTVLGFVFAASNVARLALPLRLGVAFAVAPWVDENIVQKFKKDEDSE